MLAEENNPPAMTAAAVTDVNLHIIAPCCQALRRRLEGPDGRPPS
jgi:hypothetical protein